MTKAISDIYIFCLCPCRNPVGRTGLKGRGTLGKWGPNHAADPIVTRSVCHVAAVMWKHTYMVT